MVIPVSYTHLDVYKRQGLEALVRVINHPATEGIPFILETPNDDEGWTHEIALLRNEYKQK